MLVMPLGQKVERTVMTAAQRWREEGAAEQFLKMLRFRFKEEVPFPAELEERVLKAGQADLDRWSERIFSASSLQDIFAVEPGA